MTSVITLPKELIKKGELVLLPRSEYEKLIQLAKVQSVLNEDLKQSLTEMKRGELFGPFKNSKDLIKSLIS